MSGDSFNQINTPKVWAEGEIEKLNFFLDPKIKPAANVELAEFVPFNGEIVLKTFDRYLNINDDITKSDIEEARNVTKNMYML